MLERRTAIIARALQSYNVDIAALSETRIAGTSAWMESGYTFHCIGHEEGVPRNAGVGFAIKNGLKPFLIGQPVGISPRLATMQLSLADGQVATFVSVYAPTQVADNDDKEQFYQQLDRILTEIPKKNKVFLLGDFNARVGRDFDVWQGVIGRHGVGNCNSNGLLLLQLCNQHALTLTNTNFQQANKYKNTWQHPRSKHWHMLDYVAVRQADSKDILLTRAMRGTLCYSDHHMVRSKVILSIQRPHCNAQRPKIRKVLDVAKLSNKETNNLFERELQPRLENLQACASAAESWANVRDVLYECAGEVLGFRQKKHRDWFDENDDSIRPLLKNMHAAHSVYLQDKNSAARKAAYTGLRQEVQRRLREMKNKWWADRASEIQEAYDKHNTKQLYDSLKTVYGPRQAGSIPVRSSTDNQLLTDSDSILNRWAEHFQEVLNQPSTFDSSVLTEIPDWEVNNDLDVPPTLAETVAAIKQLSSNKAPGADNLPAEIYKNGGTAVALKLTEIFKHIWIEGCVPQEFKDAKLIHLYKKKGDRSLCDNHRGISLLSVAGKILARILLARLTAHVTTNDILPESQCGFRTGRSTTDMVFAARQLQEKSQEQQKDLIMVFVDLTKAFDTVNREGLWLILNKIGCPQKFVGLIKSFHDGMMAQVTENGQTSAQFSVTSGTKQGCVLAPLLFSIFFSAMLHVAFAECQVGIPIDYRTDGGVFNIRRMQAKTKILSMIIRDLLFADDCALAAHNHTDMQEMVNRFSSAATRFGLKISHKKTVTLHQPYETDNTIPPVLIDNNPLESVSKFSYLGSTLQTDISIDNDIITRLAKAGSAFGSLTSRLWNEHGVSLATKLSVYRACILSSLLYGSESWTYYRRHIRKLDSFHLRCLRKIAKIRWSEKRSDTEVLQQCGMMGIEALIMERQMRWIGHVMRMPDSRLPKVLFCGQIHDAKRPQHGVKKRYKDVFKTTLKSGNVALTSWESTTADRPKWRSTCRSAVKHFETTRVGALVEKRTRRKAGGGPRQGEAGHRCQTCGRLCGSAIGLHSHNKTHR